MKKYLAAIFSLLPMVATFATAQVSNDIERTIEKIYDLILEETDQEAEVPDYEQIYEDLVYCADHPINLNTATKEQLDRLHFLTDLQKENLLYYVYAASTMHSIYELQLVDNFDAFTIELLLPFVTVGRTTQRAQWQWRDVMRHAKHTLIGRMDGTLEQKQGYTTISPEELAKKPNSRYVGSPYYGSLKYRFAAKDKMGIGLTMEKDAGEQFWGHYHKGFDSYSAYTQVNNLWHFNRIILGDFRATFGQGVLLSQSFMTGKTAYVTNVSPRTTGLVKKSSTDEVRFFRGIGTSVQLKNFELTAFYSIRHMDADTMGGTISSLTGTGLHRTPNDCARRNALLMQVTAANLTYRHKIFRIGATFYHAWLNTPIRPADLLYNCFRFNGSKQSGGSIDYYVRLPHVKLFGETAIAANGSVATLNAAMFMPVSTVALVILQRYYATHYDLFFANAFSKSHTNNENGIYMGAEISPIRRLKLSAYADVFKFPWLRYTASRPSQGCDALLQAEFQINRNTEIYLRAKYALQENNHATVESKTIQLTEQQRGSLRLQASYKINNFSGRTLIEGNASRQEREHTTFGMILAQDVVYDFRMGLKLSLRYAVFDAPQFDNRIYTYERDVPYMMSIPMLYGRGNRYVLMCTYKWRKYLTIAARLAQTIYTDGRETIGTGPETIKGRHRSDFRIHMQWQF